ncbi:MAG: LytR C-terminal domain-containing protein [Pseudomonadota bacterium]
MKCPYCGNAEITFIRRTRWARFIPGLEYYDCNNCGGTYSRFYIRPIHSIFIAFMAFFLTLGVYWLKSQATSPYYSEIEKYLAETSQPTKVSGTIEDFPASEKEPSAQITEPSPTDTAEHIDAGIPPGKPPVAKSEEASALEDTEPEERIDKEKLKIKVLIGNRQRASAERLAVQLQILGYTVDRIDAAGRSNFEKLTIYYKKGFKALAQEIGRSLGKDFIDKELSWESRFDLIMITGGNG